MSRHAASLFANDKRATLDQVIEACIKEMSGFIEENLDVEIILTKDKSAITKHIQGLIERAIDQNPARYMDQIYTMNLTTLDIAQVTNLSTGANSASWSPDGTQIAFLSNVGISGRSQIFIVNVDGTGFQQITPYDIDHFDGPPIWCPEDSCIFFTRFLNGVPKLMFLDLADKNAVPVLGNIFDTSLQETRLSRSPKNGFITFSSGQVFYAMNIGNKTIYPLDIEALDLSLYP